MSFLKRSRSSSREKDKAQDSGAKLSGEQTNTESDMVTKASDKTSPLLSELPPPVPKCLPPLLPTSSSPPKQTLLMSEQQPFSTYGGIQFPEQQAIIKDNWTNHLYSVKKGDRLDKGQQEIVSEQDKIIGAMSLPTLPER